MAVTTATAQPGAMTDSAEHKLRLVGIRSRRTSSSTSSPPRAASAGSPSSSPSSSSSSYYDLLNSCDVPEYVREIAIETGYRRHLSYFGCIQSWFWLHNETFNIWTHLVGFFYFLFHLLAHLYSPPAHMESRWELAPIIVQLLAYQFCMLSSSLFHTFSCHSEFAHKSWLQCDHLGILVALFGTYVSFICDVFNCHPGWRTLHLSVVVFLFSAIILLRYTPSLGSSPRTTMIQLTFFVSMGMYAFVPFTHWTVMSGGLHTPSVRSKFEAMCVPYFVAFAGLCFYISRFPEKFINSSKVHIFGASHQVWHIFVFVGMMYWYLESAGTYLSGNCSSSPAGRQARSANEAEVMEDNGDLNLEEWMERGREGLVALANEIVILLHPSSEKASPKIAGR